MIEILKTFKVNCKIAEIVTDETLTLLTVEDLEKHRKELKDIHGLDIIFTYREKLNFKNR